MCLANKLRYVCLCIHLGLLSCCGDAHQATLLHASMTHHPLVWASAQDVTALYTLGRVLGRGQFGTTRLAEDKVTGEQLACKSISKRKLT